MSEADEKVWREQHAVKHASRDLARKEADEWYRRMREAEQAHKLAADAYHNCKRLAAFAMDDLAESYAIAAKNGWMA